MLRSSLCGEGCFAAEIVKISIFIESAFDSLIIGVVCRETKDQKFPFAFVL